MLSRSKRIPEPLARSELFHRKLRIDRSPVLVTWPMRSCQPERLHHGHRSTNRSQPTQRAEEHRAQTERGKACAKLNTIKHGMTARTIMPILPQEDPKELEDRTQQAITAMKPRNPLELDLVCRAVRLSWVIDRAERAETAHLGHRVRMAARSGPETVSTRELKKVHELGSTLFFQAGIGPGYPKPVRPGTIDWDDQGE